MLLLNFIAFLGYGAFPVVFFWREASIAAVAPLWPGNEAACWWGNYIGRQIVTFHLQLATCNL